MLKLLAAWQRGCVSFVLSTHGVIVAVVVVDSIAALLVNASIGGSRTSLSVPGEQWSGVLEKVGF